MATITGTNGHDRADRGGQNLIGTSGNDRIYGLAGEDWLEGLGGHDLLDAGGGDFNTVKGGSGDDTVLTSGKGGWFDGGAGVDTMIFGYAGAARGVFDLAAGSARIGAGATFTMSGFENLSAAGGDDDIYGTDGRNVLTGGDGDDLIVARGGDDVAFGGRGGDYLDGGDGADDLRGEDGDDDLFGGAQNDVLDGGNGRDLLWGGSGNDVLKGGRGNDTLDGGESGYDTASYESHLAAVSVDIMASKAWSTVNGDAEVDELFRIDKVIGSAYADTLFAGATTALDGGWGEDLLFSGSGANALSGGAGAHKDMVSYARSTAAVNVDLSTGAASGGWAAGDTFAGVESVAGSHYGDTLKCSNSGGRVEGLGGNDLLYGGARADTIDGGQGYDQMWGGAGQDRFVFSYVGHSSPGPDWIRDFDLDEGDRIDVSKIDADPGYTGNQAFTKIIYTGTGAPGWSTDFTVGTIGVKHSDGDTYVAFNTIDQSSNSAQFDPEEMMIRLSGYHEFTLSDFVL